MKITDLKCAIIGNYPVVRITTDAGIDGFGQAESYKPYLKPFVLFYKELIVGEDPTDVERVMLNIRRMGSFKPWGAAVSAIEMALWDIAGKAAGIPVYKLLGGKVRDKVLVYNGAVRKPMAGRSPQDYAENTAWMLEAKEKFKIVKQGIGYHSGMPHNVPNFSYGEFEYPVAQNGWWYDIIEGLPDPIVVDSFINVWDRPGLGVTFNVKEAKKHLSDGEGDFFD